MQQQRGGQQPRRNARPVHFQIEGVQFAAVLERVQNKRHQAENIKMHRPGRIPAARKNEQPNEEVKQANNAQVIFDTDGFVWRSGDQAGLKLFAVAFQFVAELRPLPRAIEPPRHMRRFRHRHIINGQQHVAGTDACRGCGGVRCYFPGFYTGRSVGPRHSVVHQVIPGALQEVVPGKDDGGQRRQRQDDCTDTHAEFLSHRRPRLQTPYRIGNCCNSSSNLL